MKYPTHISKHANERIFQRTRLSAFDIARLIDQKQFVNLGEKPGQTKEYLLFYDQHSEESYFVVFRDSIDGTVITIITLAIRKKRIVKCNGRSKK